MFAHQFEKFSAAAGFDVELTADVRKCPDQVLGRVVTIHASERRVGAEILPLRRCLKNSNNTVFEDAAVFLLGLTDSFESRCRPHNFAFHNLFPFTSSAQFICKQMQLGSTRSDKSHYQQFLGLDRLEKT